MLMYAPTEIRFECRFGHLFHSFAILPYVISFANVSVLSVLFNDILNC
jgi:hypothetical protein